MPCHHLLPNGTSPSLTFNKRKCLHLHPSEPPENHYFLAVSKDSNLDFAMIVFENKIVFLIVLFLKFHEKMFLFIPKTIMCN